jgi:hypothetical protein
MVAGGLCHLHASYPDAKDTGRGHQRLRRGYGEPHRQDAIVSQPAASPQWRASSRGRRGPPRPGWAPSAPGELGGPFQAMLDRAPARAGLAVRCGLLVGRVSQLRAQLALRRRRLYVQQPGHSRGELVFILQPGDLLAGRPSRSAASRSRRRPGFAPGRRGRARAADVAWHRARTAPAPVAGWSPRPAPPGGQLFDRRAHEHAKPLIGRVDDTAVGHEFSWWRSAGGCRRAAPRNSSSRVAPGCTGGMTGSSATGSSFAVVHRFHHLATPAKPG